MEIKLSDYIANFLVENEIKDVFTVTGGGAMHLNDSFGHKEELNCIYNHHEQACSIAAEGYTRLTNKLAAVCVTTGPGGTNAITGVYGAWVDSIPMFVVSGQVKRETTIAFCEAKLRQLGDQEFNIVDCVSTMTKYAVMIKDPNEIKYHLEKALYLAKNGRPGPVWIDVPSDVQAARINIEKLKSFNPIEENIEEIENPKYDDEYTKKILEKIAEAKRPVILAGTGVRLANSHSEFLELAEKLQIPVVTAWNAHDVMPNEHPLFAGKPGTVGTRGGNFVVQNSDLLISIGCRLNIRMISYNYKNFAKNAYKIVIDIDKEELKKPTVSIDMPIHANLNDVIKSLLKSDYVSNNEEHKKWLKWCKTINVKYPVVLKEYYNKQLPINPYVFIDELFNELEEDTKIITGNGSACVIGFQAAKIKNGQRLFTNSGCAAMGYGFPAAIGAAVATKGEKIICLDGDGSFQMNIQELQTVVHNKLNLKIFIINNNGYHSIRQTQTNLFKPPLVGVSQDNGISFPDLKKIAYAYGVDFERIKNISEINEKIRRVLEVNGPIICEIIVDEKQNFEPKLSSRALPDGTMVSPELDDMFPFLPKEEYEKIKKSAINL